LHPELKKQNGHCRLTVSEKCLIKD